MGTDDIKSNPQSPVSLHPGEIIESNVFVDDMERAIRFYKEVLGLEVAESSERLTAINVTSNQVLLLSKKGASTESIVKPFGTIPPHDGTGPQHLAFAIRPSEVEGWAEHLKRCAVTLESRLRWPEGGESLYFRDPDDNLLELKSSNWRGEEFD